MQALAPAALLLVLLAPTVLAASGDAIAGELRVAAPPRVAGALDAWTTRGALDLSAAVAAGESPTLRLASARGELVETQWAKVFGSVNYRTDHHTRGVVLGEGTLRLARCDPGCLVLLATEEGALGVRGTAEGALAWRGAERLYCVDFCTAGEGRGFVHPSPRGSFLLGTEGLRVSDGAATARGTLTLVLRGAVAEHVGSDGRVLATVDARAEDGKRLAPGVEAGRVHRHAVLHVDASGLDAGLGRASFMAESLAVALAGEIGGRATGDLTYAGHPQRVEDADVLVAGDLRLALRPASPGERVPAGEGASMGLEGTATRLRVGERTVRPLDPVPAAGGGLLVLLLLALALVGLYSRIRRDRVLENENRGRIVRLLRGRPGLTSREVAAALGLARVVVQHHLVVLLTHRFVLRQRIGRADRYHAADAPLDPGAVERARTLRDPTRRRIADAVAAQGALSQADVAAATGVSVRLASYHLSRLERAGLVQRLDGMPRRYDAAPALREREEG